MATDFPARYNELQGLMSRLGREIPGVAGAFGNLHKAGMADGALNAKTKELIALGIAVAIRCESCITYHVHDALKLGATRAEILDTLAVAVVMGGGPAMMDACEAYAALDQFSSTPT